MTPSASSKNYSLSQLLASVRRCLETSFTGQYWVRAETSDLRRAGSSGHAYLELLEKNEQGGIQSRVRANIWAHTYRAIEYKLERAGAGKLQSGLSVLVLVQVSFHEQYGLALNILDLDPSYSLGEIARLRLETLNRLKREGVLGDNKALPLPRPLQRLAIVSSATAAGLGDFLDQLRGNRYGLRFYTALYQAQMQGEQTAQSVIDALERIAQSQEHFDAVIIIRGGGAVSELRAFDAYSLCYYCTQYPLPILCGIGHERDESLLDLVAHTSLKTPTAVAEYLIHQALEEYSLITQYAKALGEATARLSLERGRALDLLIHRLPIVAGRALQSERLRLDSQIHRLRHNSAGLLARHRTSLEGRIPQLRYLSRGLLEAQREQLKQYSQRLTRAIPQRMETEQRRLEHLEQAVRLSHPDKILARGFAIVARADGSILARGEALQTGEELQLRLEGRSVPVVVQ